MSQSLALCLAGSSQVDFTLCIVTSEFSGQDATIFFYLLKLAQWNILQFFKVLKSNSTGFLKQFYRVLKQFYRIFSEFFQQFPLEKSFKISCRIGICLFLGFCTLPALWNFGFEKCPLCRLWDSYRAKKVALGKWQVSCLQVYSSICDLCERSKLGPKGRKKKKSREKEAKTIEAAEKQEREKWFITISLKMHPCLHD